MKPKVIIVIVTISLVLLLSPAFSLAATGDQSDGGHGAMDMSGHNMDMSNHDMDMSGHSMDMQDNGSMAGGEHNSGMNHEADTSEGDANHGNGAHSGHNSQQGQGGSTVKGSAVLGGFGFVNGLIILSASILKRKSLVTGGN